MPVGDRPVAVKILAVTNDLSWPARTGSHLRRAIVVSGLTVTQDTTTTTVSSTLSSVTYGAEGDAVFTVTVTPANAPLDTTNGETVTVNVGTTSCTVTLMDGTGTCSIDNTALAVGNQLAVGSTPHLVRQSLDNFLYVHPTAPVPAAPRTCQITLAACAPLIRLMLLAAAVLSAAPTWKMNTELGSPWPSRVRVPVSANAVTTRPAATWCQAASQSCTGESTNPRQVAACKARPMR